MYADNQTFSFSCSGGGSGGGSCRSEMMTSSMMTSSGMMMVPTSTPPDTVMVPISTSPDTVMVPTSTSPDTVMVPTSTPPDTVIVNIKEDNPADIFNGSNPDLMVFDLDWTLWQFDCDKHVIPPFTKHLYFNTIYDRYGRPSNPYPDVPAIISALVDANIPFAIASRNPSAGPIEQLLRQISIFPKTSTKQHIKTIWDALPSREYFHAYSSAEYGNGKDRHFKAIYAASGIPFNRMLFFDDLPDNIKYASIQGTTSILVNQKNGLNWNAMISGITEYRNRSFSTSFPVTVSSNVVGPTTSSTTTPTTSSSTTSSTSNS